MDDHFDRLLDFELARVLNPIVRSPAPRRTRSWRDGRRGRIRLFDGGLADGASRSILLSDTRPVAMPAVIGVRSSDS